MTPLAVAGALAAASAAVSVRRRAVWSDNATRTPDVVGGAAAARRLVPIVAVVVAVATLLFKPTSTVLALLLGGLLTAVVVRRLVTRSRLASTRRRRQHAVIELCDALAAELRAGMPAGLALRRATSAVPEWDVIATATALDGDIPTALRGCAALPGAESLRLLAAGWEVAGRSGAAQARVLDRLAAGLRSDDEARSEVTAALGPPRATAKMLAALPVFGLLLGSSMGARPLEFLLDTGPGLACLAVGVGLALLGVVWVERLAAAAEA